MLALLCFPRCTPARATIDTPATPSTANATAAARERDDRAPEGLSGMRGVAAEGAGRAIVAKVDVVRTLHVLVSFENYDIIYMCTILHFGRNGFSIFCHAAFF